jgi:protoporphyrinogen oxidase
MYVEVAKDPGESVEVDNLFEEAVKDLSEVGILESGDEILVRKCLEIPYAYVVYDRSRESSLKKVHTFLKNHGIHSVGRYGEWKYSSMETSILDGKSVAENIS